MKNIKIIIETGEIQRMNNIKKSQTMKKANKIMKTIENDEHQANPQNKKENHIT